MFYKEVNLPKVPERLLNFVFTPEKSGDIGYNIKHVKDNVQLKPCLYKYGSVNYEPLTSWLREIIPGITENDIKFQSSSNGTHIVHSDIIRKYALNYILDVGGEDIATSWYKEINKPLVRSKTKAGIQADTGSVDYSNLETLESVVFKPNIWYLLRTDILHDVSHISGVRKSITISFSDTNLYIIQRLGFIE